MSEPFRFFSLPFELREVIWELALPDQVIEFGEPCDPDIPERDLKHAWVISRKLPTIAHLCHESRQIAMCPIKVPDGIDPDCMRDERVWFENGKTIHFNSPDWGHMNNLSRFMFMDNLIGSYEAAELSKNLSLSADLIHPFLPFHELCGIDDTVVWNLFIRLKGCIISLHTICVRATKKQARDTGLFGHGAEPVQLLDPFDMETLRKYETLWSQSYENRLDPAAKKFWEAVNEPNTRKFTFRIERWLAETEAIYLKTTRPDEAPSGPPLQSVIDNLSRYPSVRHQAWARQYLENFPKLDLRIMFRLCPRGVGNVIT
ncbi:uncharacterized protein N7529_005150 [Penicillium soppii]|uniref:uncharacterized protein n=1 Tax=Penicillium soppii TaxID=69789 RepID=UPI002548E09F|nr:uncharacterized protein N7529_005150 [Penicillium soppii]KAJ5872797.1 hypothetical protein N7529_005150 [Penicillium soppii]